MLLNRTFTESVADYVQCPLYRVSGGELSTDVQQVERRLKKIFHTTKKWNAVVLFDEADVLMAKRKENELERNTIVAGGFSSSSSLPISNTLQFSFG